MPTIQEEILEKFYRKVAESGDYSDAMVEDLRGLFESDKKPKADDLVTIFLASSEEDTV